MNFHKPNLPDERYHVLSTPVPALLLPAPLMFRLWTVPTTGFQGVDQLYQQIIHSYSTCFWQKAEMSSILSFITYIIIKIVFYRNIVSLMYMCYFLTRSMVRSYFYQFLKKIFVVLGLEPRPSYLLDKCSTSQLHSQPQTLFLK